MANTVEIKIVVDGKEGIHTIELTDEQLKKLGGTSKDSGEKLHSAFSKFPGILIAINQGLELAKKGFDLIMIPIQNAGQFEQYEAALKVMLGSTKAAKQRLSELVDFAKTTPFELPQVVEAANQLQALGRYSQENLRMLGDLASASGKPMEQALSAFSKMASGQKGIAVDMFRDLLITTDDWQRATGKGISANGELLASTEEMLSALPRILEEKNFSGMMEMQAQTFNGAVSNMQDAIGQLMTQWGNELLPLAKGVVSGITEITSAFIDTQTEFEKTAEKSTQLESRFDTLSNQYFVLAGKTNRSAEETKILQEIISSLQSEFPNYLQGVDLLNGSYSENEKAIKGAKDQLNEYIAAQVKAALMADENSAIIESTSKKLELTRRKTAKQVELNAAKDAGTLNQKEIIDVGSDLGGNAAQAGANLTARTVGERLNSEIQALDKEIAQYQSDIDSRRDKINQIQDEVTKEFGITNPAAPTTPATPNPNGNPVSDPGNGDKDWKKSVMPEDPYARRDDMLTPPDRSKKVKRDLDLESEMYRQSRQEIIEESNATADLEIRNSQLTTDEKIRQIENQLLYSKLSAEEQKALADDLTAYQVQKWEEEKASREASVREMQGYWHSFSQDILDTSITGAERMKRITDQIKLQFIQAVGDMVIAQVMGETEKTAAAQTGAVARVATVAWEAAVSVGKSMLTIAATLWDGMLKFFSWGFPFTLPLAAAAVAGGISLVKSSIKAVGFAEGGVVDRPTFAMIGEGTQPEIVTPLRTFQQVIQQDIIPKLELQDQNRFQATGPSIDYDRLGQSLAKYVPKNLAVDGIELLNRLDAAEKRRNTY